jgi:hypothetical protein
MQSILPPARLALLAVVAVTTVMLAGSFRPAPVHADCGVTTVFGIPSGVSCSDDGSGCNAGISIFGASGGCASAGTGCNASAGLAGASAGCMWAGCGGGAGVGLTSAGAGASCFDCDTGAGAGLTGAGAGADCLGCDTGTGIGITTGEVQAGCPSGNSGGCAAGYTLDSQGNCAVSGAVVTTVQSKPPYNSWSCSLANTKVTALDQGGTQYYFDLKCGGPKGSVTLGVAAHYTPSTQLASELIGGSDGQSVISQFKCSADPWASAAASCSLVKVDPSASSDPWFGLAFTAPTSAQTLSPSFRQQLTDAYNQAHTTAFPAFDPKGTCQISNLKAQPAAGGSSYSFDLQCPTPSGPLQVSVKASYVAASKSATEQLSNAKAGLISYDWSCAQDPWAQGTAGCSFGAWQITPANGKDPIFGLMVSQLEGPISAHVLTSAQEKQIAQAEANLKILPLTPSASH